MATSTSVLDRRVTESASMNGKTRPFQPLFSDCSERSCSSSARVASLSPPISSTKLSSYSRIVSVPVSAATPLSVRCPRKSPKRAASPAAAATTNDGAWPSGARDASAAAGTATAIVSGSSIAYAGKGGSAISSVVFVTTVT